MTVASFILFTLYFLFCQYLIEKDKIPQRLFEIKIVKLLLIGTAFIAVSIVIGTAIHVAKILVPMVTIFVASLIGSKFRSSYTKMERGEGI